jgi:hypothetical protein
LLDEYRQEFAAHFAEEYHRLKTLGLSDEEVKEEFTRSLVTKESSLLQKVAMAQSIDQIALNDEERNARFAQDCHKAVRKITKKSAYLFVICTDGSDGANAALSVTLNLRNKHDGLCVFHAYQASKNSELPEQYHPSSIRSSCEAMLDDKIAQEELCFHFEERYSRTALRTLTDFLDHYRDDTKAALLPGGGAAPDFVVMGSTGRKGIKDQYSTLGSTVDLALRQVHVPCVIAKKPVAPGPRSFVMCVNFSDCSKKGLDILLQIVRPRDSLHLLFVEKEQSDPSKIQSIQDYYENEMALYGPANSLFLRLPLGAHHGVQHAIEDHVNGPQCPDYLVLAPRTVLDRGHSAITEHVMTHCRTNIILCKV